MIDTNPPATSRRFGVGALVLVLAAGLALGGVLAGPRRAGP
jgi:hypothetical protein